jgi:hypothetical protein
VIRLGVIGLSEGNGHPFSFSAIVNGYDDDAFAQAGWPVIHDYLRVRQAADFGVRDARVTHAWTQDPAVTRRLCAACNIPNTCAAPDDMASSVDAVIVARDDWRMHHAIAAPFLDKGLPVLVDKPLSLRDNELAWFEPHLRAGRLMSTSGLRYAAELDPLRVPVADWPTGTPRLINATVLNDLACYGVHMLDALGGLGLVPGRSPMVSRLDLPHEAIMLRPTDGPPIMLNCLGAVGKTFRIDVFGTAGHAHFDLHDNFTAFRRLLHAFVAMIENGVPPIEPDETLAILRVITTAGTRQ